MGGSHDLPHCRPSLCRLQGQGLPCEADRHHDAHHAMPPVQQNGQGTQVGETLTVTAAPALLPLGPLPLPLRRGIDNMM